MQKKSYVIKEGVVNLELTNKEYSQYLLFKLGCSPSVLGKPFDDIIPTIIKGIGNEYPDLSIPEVLDKLANVQKVLELYCPTIDPIQTEIAPGGFKNTPEGIVESAKQPLQGKYDENGKLIAEESAEGPKVIGKIDFPPQIHPLDKCTYIPKMVTYVYEYAKSVGDGKNEYWFVNQWGNKQYISEEEYRIINDTIIASQMH